MNWLIDLPTQTVARAFPLRIYSLAPLEQDPGGSFDPANWQSRLRPRDSFPQGASTCSPGLIVSEFKASHHLSALALTVCWGGMARTMRHIYRGHNLQHIHDVLDKCAQSISKSDSIQAAWDLLTNSLQWTSVIASKTLHFLCRALKICQDPPVPVDAGVIRKYVWPGFRIGIPPSQRLAIGDWEGNTFAAYCRYMTAILTWAEMKEPLWTTTQVEATIYAENAK